MKLGRLTVRLWLRPRYWTVGVRTNGARWSLVATCGPLAIMWARA